MISNLNLGMIRSLDPSQVDGVKKEETGISKGAGDSVSSPPACLKSIHSKIFHLLLLLSPEFRRILEDLRK